MTKHERGFSSPTQILRRYKALLERRSISKTETLKVNVSRLAAILQKFRRQFLWPMGADYRGPENTAYYRPTPGFDLAKLRFPRSAKHLGEGRE